MGRKTAITAPPLYHPAVALFKGGYSGETCHAIMTPMGRVNASYWVAAITAALGRDPRTPEEALGALGAFLRSDPAEKERFLREAHTAWVRGGWEVRGDSTPAARVILAALGEATRRLAERYGWQRIRVKTQVRVPKEVLNLLRVAPKGVKLEGEGVFIASSRFTERAAWKAAYRLTRGETVTLLPKASEKEVLATRAKILEKVKILLQERESQEEVRLPWGETVRVLPGDKWEDLGAPEPRIAAAIRGLRELVRGWEAREEERRREWEEEIRYLSSWVHKDPEEPLPRYSRVLRTWEIVVRGAAKMRPPTYGEVKELLERHPWAAVRLLGALVAYEVSVLGFSDPENAYQEGILAALGIWGRLQRKQKGKGLNPLLFLVPELRKVLLESRAKEVGIFRLSLADARKLRRYFYLREKKGLDPVEAGRKAGLSPELLFALQAEDLSGDALVELGVEPWEEVDYDTFLLRAKVEELRGVILRWWGPKGGAFVEALMEGQTPLGAQLQAGLSDEEAEEILDFLRSELEGWVE